MPRDKTIIKKVIQAIEEDVLDGDVFDLVRMIEMLLGFEVPRQLILEYIGEENAKSQRQRDCPILWADMGECKTYEIIYKRTQRKVY